MDDNHASPGGDRATMRTIYCALGLTAAIAGVASYLHALNVVEAADGRTVVAHCIPALADLTIAASSVNIADAYRHRKTGQDLPRLSIASLVLSIAITLGANWAAGSPHEVPVWLVNVWPPVAFMLALESLLDFTRRHALRSAKRVTDDGIPCPHGIGMSRDEAIRIAFFHARDCEGKAPTYTALGEAFGIDRGVVRKLVTTSPRPGPPETPPTSEAGPAGLTSENVAAGAGAPAAGAAGNPDLRTPAAAYPNGDGSRG